MQDATDGATQRYARGQTIGDKYRLVRRLDEGGMGTVWVAHNVDLDVHVAIKLLRSELGEGAAKRLANEARIVARLEHPAIIRVFDCGSTEHGDPFIAMELLSGECLADTLGRLQRVGPTRAVQLLLPIVDALANAHARGIVHRDVKPENIFLAGATGRIQPKLLDFGVARAEPDTRLTLDGAVVGSPAYMSPEQARGAEADSRSDIWALSVVLYEALSGTSPFEDANYNATLCAIIEEEPPSLVELGACDETLAAVIARGLAKDPDARFQTMRELGSALAEWLLSRGIEEDAARVSVRAQWLSDTSSLPPVAVPVSVPPERPSRPLPEWVRETPIAVSSPPAHATRSTRRWPLIAAGLVLGSGAVALLVEAAGSATAERAAHVAAAPSEPARVVRPPNAATAPVRTPPPAVQPDAGAKPIRAARRRSERDLKNPY